MCSLIFTQELKLKSSNGSKTKFKSTILKRKKEEPVRIQQQFLPVKKKHVLVPTTNRANGPCGLELLKKNANSAGRRPFSFFAGHFYVLSPDPN